MKKIICIAIAFCILFATPVIAENNSEYSAEVEKLIGEEIVFTDEIVTFSFQKARNNQSITLNLVGMSSYLDFSSMDSSFDATLVEYESSNPEVAVAWNGRILARGVGTAQITINYLDLQQIIDVTVKKEISSELKEALEYSVYTQNSTRAVVPQERLDIIYKASDMVTVQWTPTQSLVGWNNEMSYEPGNIYFGVPYSQSVNQVDDIEFSSALSNGDFYDAYSRFSIQMPKYGSDCSGFVSIAWGINRITTSTFYNNYPSIGDFTELQTGDAVVSTQDRHIILVSTNYETPPGGSSYTEPYLVCFEQLQYDADLTFHTYAQLSRLGYKAISKFN